MIVVIIECNFFGRLVSGDYRGFVMIWEVEDVKEELVSLERRLTNLPKDRCLSAFFHLAVPLLSQTLSDNPLTIPPRKEKGEGIFFIRPGSRLVQQQGRTDVAEVILGTKSWHGKDLTLYRWFNTVPCWSTVAMLLP